jgi:hypothetical protein
LIKNTASRSLISGCFAVFGRTITCQFIAIKFSLKMFYWWSIWISIKKLFKLDHLSCLSFVWELNLNSFLKELTILEIFIILNPAFDKEIFFGIFGLSNIFYFTLCSLFIWSLSSFSLYSMCILFNSHRKFYLHSHSHKSDLQVRIQELRLLCTKEVL